MSTAALFTKMFQCFVLARRVNHFYWLHTDADDSPGATSVENIQRIISRMSGMYIRKLRVNFESTNVRGNIERYPWGVVIHVRASQSELWQRFTVVKELCHVLLDVDESDWSVDVVKTIRDLLDFVAFDGEESNETRSEKLAEVMALELIYPIEFRRKDRDAVAANEVKVQDIAELRKVPPLWIERAWREQYLDACEAAWQAIKELPDDDRPLGPEVPRPAELA